jgi:hypothetical protein
MIRRLILIALGVSLVHLNVERADVVCASHGQDHHAAGHSERQTASASHHDHANANASVATDEDCQTPVQADCCQALVSCSGVPSLGSEQFVVDVAKTHDRAVGERQVEPLSSIRAPEPPPPRA